MRANLKAKPKRGAPQRGPEDDDDDMPRDIEADRQSLSRRIDIGVSNVLKRWRSCAEPACKRARGCCAPRGVCGNDKPPRPIKPEHDARNRAQLHRMIREQAERLEAVWKSK
jgi:hypothetical protein